MTPTLMPVTGLTPVTLGGSFYGQLTKEKHKLDPWAQTAQG